MSVLLGKNNSPISWFGGKQTLIPLLLSLLPEHETYVEVFGGGASLLFQKHPSRFEVYNDKDQHLVNFFRVLRDKTHSQELQRLLALTPYARGEYEDCAQTWQEETDSVEQARRWYCLIRQSFGGQFQNGWGYSTSFPVGGKHQVLNFRRVNDALQKFTDRLSLVQIEGRDFQEMFHAYDSPATLFYCDPPYLPEMRKAGGYECEMSRDEHINLLHTVQAIQGKVLLSGYDAPLYHEHLHNWRCVRQPVTCHGAGRTRASDLQGENKVREQQKRTECIWIKPNSERHVSLWDAITTA